MCMSLIKPNDTLRVTVTLTSERQNTSIHTQTTKTADIHTCIEFPVNHPEENKVYIVAINNSFYVGQKWQK